MLLSENCLLRSTVLPACTLIDFGAVIVCVPLAIFTVRDTLAAYHLEKRLESSIRVLTSADERFLGAAFAAMEREYGSVDGYLEQALGIAGRERDILAARYLEP